MYNIENKSFLFEIGYKICFTKGLERYVVYLDPRSKLKVGNKKKKVKKLKVGDKVGNLEIKEIESPLVSDSIIGIKKLKKIYLIELNQFDKYLSSPKVFDEEELFKVLKDSSFTFVNSLFDGIELFTNDGQRIYLPFAIANIPPEVILYSERVTKGKTCLEVF